MSGGKVIIVESDPNAALTASLKGFEVKNLEQALPLSDMVILVKEQAIDQELILKAKTNCIFASLQEKPSCVNIDIEAL